MAIVSDTIPATGMTATALAQYFLQRHEGDVEAAAYEMEALLQRNRLLWRVLLGDLIRIALEERAVAWFAGLTQAQRSGEGKTVE